MIAWELAGTVARSVAGGGAPSEPLPGDLADLGRRAEAAVVAYTGLVPASPLPSPQEVSRGEWADANVGLMRTLIEPLSSTLDARAAQLPGAVRSVAGSAIGAEIGALLGYMGRRVLGQYEVALSAGDQSGRAAPRLLLVGANLRESATRLEAPLDDLLAWVTVHEVTHAVQFSSVPWLQPHLGGLVAELLAGADVSLDAGRASMPDLSDLRGLVERARDGGLVTLVAGPQRRELLDRIQATMALVEGHAEHVMDAAGAPLVPDLPRLRARLERRRAQRSPLASILDRLLGLEMKLRQYRDGKAFCDAVVAHEGPAGLNRAFASPELLPTSAELADPLAWISRSRMRELPRAL